MAAHGYVSDTLDGVGPADRFERHGLDGCRLTDPGNDYVVDEAEQEVVYGLGVDGRSDARLAAAIADGLMSERETRRALRLNGASSVGLGLNVTGGRAYVTMAVC